MCFIYNQWFAGKLSPWIYEKRNYLRPFHYKLLVFENNNYYFYFSFTVWIFRIPIFNKEFFTSLLDIHVLHPFFVFFEFLSSMSSFSDFKIFSQQNQVQLFNRSAIFGAWWMSQPSFHFSCWLAVLLYFNQFYTVFTSGFKFLRVFFSLILALNLGKSEHYWYIVLIYSL